MPEGCAAIQRDHGRLEKCADSKLCSTKGSANVLDLRRNNVRHIGSVLGDICLGSGFAEKAMERSKLHMEPAMCPCHKEGPQLPRLH